tara:strand:- start:56573 stop:58114 length:1542 start_codon:yes stop_codon:yes gene_type:complete
MENVKSKHNQQKPHGTSLTARLTLPTLLVLGITLTVIFLFGTKVNEGLYNHQTIESLKNTLQLTQKTLNDGWENTRGTAIRTEEILQQYTAQVLAGRLDFIGFAEESGVVIIDSFTGKTIQAYPLENIRLDDIDIQQIIKFGSQNYIVTDLQKGGFALSTYFPPLGLHLVAFNKRGFAQTNTKESQRLLLLAIFSITAILIITMMLIVIHISISRPLRAMQQKMDNILAENDYDTHLDITAGSKEIQALTLSFNTLFSHINTRDKQIHEHAHLLEHLVTERTKELKKAQSQLVLSERLAAIGEFASSVAHELRNPLSSIKMGVEKIALIEGIEGNNKRRLTLIQKEVDRLSEMLKGILVFAAPTPTKLENTNLCAFIKDITPLMSDLAQERHISLKIDKLSASYNVQADTDKLKQTFINVIKNASEAAPEKSKITLHAHSAGDYINIVIENQGQPIPIEVENRLFEPFFTTKSSGTGLGLPTTKRIMHEMGGDITIKNAGKNKIQTTLTLMKV